MTKAEEEYMPLRNPKPKVTIQQPAPCPAVVTVRGEVFRCDWPTDPDGRHRGWAHANRDAQVLWTDGRLPRELDAIPPAADPDVPVDCVPKPLCCICMLPAVVFAWRVYATPVGRRPPEPGPYCGKHAAELRARFGDPAPVFLRLAR